MKQQRQRMKRKKPLWFKAKMYGWGWTPVTWQGWLVTLLYIFFIISTFRRVDSHSNSVSDTLIGIFPRFVIATFLLILICYETGEKPFWRWGTKKR